MITGDNPLTAKAIADEAGVDDFLAEATPEDKMALIRREQAGGQLVAMTGDGTNDAPALAQADVGVAMNTGTQAAKEAGNMVDLDSNPTKLIEIVEIGKQLLITRGSLTTFSIANDVAKYFAIIPAMFAGAFPVLDAPERDGPREPAERDPLGRHLQRARDRRADPARRSAGCGSAPLSAAALLRRNLLIYGVGGIVAPFVGIKADRPRRRRPGDRLVRRQLLPALIAFVVFTAPRRSRLPARRHRRRPGRASPTRPTARSSSGRRGRRLAAPRPEFTGARYFRPAPPLPATATTPCAAAPPTSGRRTRPARRGRRSGSADYRRSKRARRRRAPCRSTPSPRPARASTPTSRPRTRACRRRVARARGLELAHVLQLVDEHTSQAVARLPRRARRQRARAQPRARRGDLYRDRYAMSTGHAPDLPRCRSRCRQDVRDARRGAPPGRAGHRRRGRDRRDTRPRSTRRPRSASSRSSRGAASTTAARRSRRWTSTPSSPAGRQSRSSTSSRTRTSRARGTRSAGRTSRSCSTPGSTVISTLNIQHLESLNDVVEQITGVKQRETIPDEIVRRADQIELVDMDPEAIRRRLAHGNIYPAERIDAALGNYFRAGNLGALRELALLWVADRVDDAAPGVSRAPRDRAPLGDARARARGAHRARRRRPARPPRGADGGPRARRPDRRARALAGRARVGCERTCSSSSGRSSSSSAAATARSSAPTWARRSSRQRARSTPRRSCSARRAARGWRELYAGLGHQPRDPRLGHRSRRPRDQPRGRAPRSDPNAAPQRTAAVQRSPGARRSLGSAIGLVGLPRADRRAQRLARGSRAPERPAALPLARRRRRRRRRPLARARLRARRVPARQLLLHAAGPHLHDRRGREPPRARRLPRGRGGRERLRRALRASRCRGAPRARRGGRCSSDSPARTSVAESSSTRFRRVLGLDGVALLEQRCATAGAARARRAPRLRPGPRTGTRSSSRSENAARRPAASSATRRRTHRILVRLRPRDRVLARTRGARGEGVDRPGRSPPPASCELRSCPPSPTTSARRSPASRPRPRACSRTTSTGRRRRRGTFLETIDEETDRLNALVGNLLDMSRIQTGALQVASGAGRASRRSSRLRSRASARAADGGRGRRRGTAPRGRRRRAARAGPRERDRERDHGIAAGAARARRRRTGRRSRRHPRVATAAPA